ncbi:dihydroorotase [Megasphaera vaginalis (ex Srinivasan et al. 2021)]|uniref:Dihydroorotase n=1 Tax=Megasphaera vaginalis (ex Srinivasan et al. 2021) TaxID=1111454 RepID=U7UJT7_9FIRM|nr:dihydroorotase [Megasphaera vaginalis (ex Srinivasan et al. 2021)]ERT59677.1 dihydro-orotase-like protein [Megasphaera vaginalis (ex Srinivasan et al. 2021)]
MALLVKNGRVINPALQTDDICDILIDDGKFQAVGKHLQADGAVVFDASGLVVAPGFIDMHVHLRQPGQSGKETIASGTQAAAAGGITRVVTMPNTDPVIDKAIIVEGLKYKAEREGVVKVDVIGALSKNQEGKELSAMGAMADAGAVAFSDDGHYVESADFMRKAMEYADMLHKLVIDHCEDGSLVAGGYMHEGAVSNELGLKGRPAVAEDISVARDILLAEATHAAVHIAHISTKNAIDMVRRAKAKGIRVTAEATPQHMILTDEALRGFDPRFKVNPPLRSEEHRAAVVAGLLDGTIDAIVTDHAPHTWEEKDRSLNLAPSGFVGLETSVGTVLTYLYHTGSVDLTTIVRAMSTAQAEILGLDAGVIAVGKAADLTILDLHKEWVVDSGTFYSKGKSTPFDDMILKGKAVATIVDGEIVMKDGEVLR